jgi:hypothetical protein
VNYDSPESSEPCGVFDPNTGTYCSTPQIAFRRCGVHYRALKRTTGGKGSSVYDALRAMPREQREIALDMLDSNTKKVRPKFEWSGDEETLALETEKKAKGKPS